VNSASRAARQGDVPYYGATGQVGWIDGHIFDEELVLLGEDGAPFLQGGKAVAYMIRGKSWVNNHAHVLRMLGKCPNAFLMHQLNQVDYHPYVSGTTRLKLPQKPMRSIPFHMPPLQEQHRIVAAIDSYLTRLDNAVALLERVQENLKRYRASVLKAAVEGRLVPIEAELARREGRSYGPASELLKHILAERKTRWSEAAAAKVRSRTYEEPAAPDTASLPDLPEGWCWATLDQVCCDALIGLVRSRDAQLQGASGYEYLKMDAIGMDGTLDLSGLVRVDASATEAERYSLRAGDVLFNTRNSVELVGKTASVRAARPGLLFNNNIMRLRFPSELRPAFLAWEMCSPSFRTRLDRVKRATTSVAAVYAKDLFPLPVALPPAPEQERISDAIERACSAADSVSAQCRGAVEHCRRLRQAILNWAFAGKLVEQDPSDEPASVVLGRIKAERVAAGEAKPRARKRRSTE